MSRGADANTPSNASNRDKAVALALEQARGDMTTLAAEAPDWAARCELLSLPAPENGVLHLSFLDAEFSFYIELLSFYPQPDPVREILMLRYLSCKGALPAGEEPLAYRELPGAAFYVEPFRSRSVVPLAAAAGENLDALGQCLERYEAAPLTRGDASWRIQVLGRVWLELVCYEPDEEFPAGCELFFAPVVSGVYSADEAAMLGQLFCLGLLRQL